PAARYAGIGRGAPVGVRSFIVEREPYGVSPLAFGSLRGNRKRRFGWFSELHCRTRALWGLAARLWLATRASEAALRLLFAASLALASLMGFFRSPLARYAGIGSGASVGFRSFIVERELYGVSPLACGSLRGNRARSFRSWSELHFRLSPRMIRALRGR